MGRSLTLTTEIDEEPAFGVSTRQGNRSYQNEEGRPRDAYSGENDHLFRSMTITQTG